VTLAEVLRYVDETPDGDVWPLIQELAATGDRSLVPEVRAALDRFVAEGRWSARDQMAYLYAKLAGVEALPVLLRLMAADDDSDWLRTAISVVVQLDRPGSHDLALPLVDDSDPRLRQAALWTVGIAYEPADLDVLRAALSDPNPEIRRAAVAALPSFEDDPRGLETAVAAFRDSDVWVRHHAVMRYAWAAPASFVDDLIPLVDDPDGPVRSAIGEALGRLAKDSDRASAATEALVRLLGDPASSVRRSAARGIGYLDGPLEPLRPLAGDADSLVRVAVAGAFASRGGPEFLDLLHRLAADEVGEVRWHVALSLAKRQWAAARPLLESLAGDRDPLVREAAVEGLDTK
jgi:HEAT repeat protein